MTIVESTTEVAEALPPRTRLYHLAPIGVGTATVESLTGYLMRLAQAHCVATSALITDELLPVLRPEGLGDLPPASWLGRFARHLNGTGELARATVTALARLTGRPDLAALTLSPWSAVISPHGLRRRRVWCRACFAEALHQGTVLYEPLLWAIPIVTMCARHQIRLSDRCPYPDCGRRLPILAAHARPGHCSWCKRVLGVVESEIDGLLMSHAEIQWSCWVTDQIGEFLAASPTFGPTPPPISVGEAIEAFTIALGKQHDGTHAAFARAVGVHANLIHQWRTEQLLPTLPLLLRVSYALGISLIQLVSGDTAALSAIPTKHTSPVPTPQRTVRKPSQVLEMAELRQKMAALDIDNRWPPLSGAAAARHVGCSAAALCRACPGEWQHLVMRYRAYRTAERELRSQELTREVRQAMLQLNAQGLYPSTKRIIPLLHRRIHPRRADFHVIRRQILQELGWTLDPSGHSQHIPTQTEAARRSSLPLSVSRSGLTFSN
jgi:transcriptional regulator with XRE-family HTH domain